MTPSTSLQHAHKAVQEAIDSTEGNDRSRMAFLIARAAFLAYAEVHGNEHAAESCYALADEFASRTGGRRG